MKKQMAKIKLPDGTVVEGEVVQTFERQVFNDPWEPENGSMAFFIGINTVHEGRFSKSWSPDVALVETGNCFTTKKIADHEAKRESLLRRMRNFARANGGEGEWSIFYYKKENELEVFCGPYSDSVGRVTFASEEVAEEAMLRYGDEIKALYEEEV